MFPITTHSWLWLWLVISLSWGRRIPSISSDCVLKILDKEDMDDDAVILREWVAADVVVVGGESREICPPAVMRLRFGDKSEWASTTPPAPAPAPWP
mmetsp:Transcript_28321/g.47581  ORF Transcript_28321/g.47581 Transcript_28321/m.47581 type:complete len:97 (-) Transcript_28321:5357-5647(-)